MKAIVLRVFDRYDRATYRLDQAIQLVLAAGILLMFLLLLLSVASRYVINRPFFWLTEGAGYLSALVGLWGSSTCLRYSGHMQVNLLQDHLKKRGGAIATVVAPGFVILTNALLIYYCYMMITAGYRFVDMGRFEYSPSGFFIVFWPRLLLPSGFLLIAVQSLNVVGYAVRRIMGEPASEPT